MLPEQREVTFKQTLFDQHKEITCKVILKANVKYKAISEVKRPMDEKLNKEKK